MHALLVSFASLHVHTHVRWIEASAALKASARTFREHSHLISSSRTVVTRNFVFDFKHVTIFLDCQDRYKERGFNVDSLICWEASPHTDAQVLSQVPDEMLPHYIYFNIPAPTTISSSANPLNMMKAVTKVRGL